MFEETEYIAIGNGKFLLMAQGPGVAHVEVVAEEDLIHVVDQCLTATEFGPAV